MVGKFERAIPLVAGSLVVGMIGLAVFDPPKKDTARPKAVLELPEMLDSFETAAGPALPAGLVRINAPGTVAESMTDGITVKRRTKPVQAGSLHTAEALDSTFERIGYDLKSISESGAPVPRVFLASLPKDMGEIRETAKRKAIFFRTVLPLVLQANDEIRADRERLWHLQALTKKGQKLPAVDRLWLIVMSERYKVKRGDIDGLLARVDVVPPSLALAQAAEESGWGTSRFSRLGNAIFGEWTFSAAAGDGIVPKEREAGKTHRVKVFKSLLHSVRAYARNLNTHRAYREFRKGRLAMRRDGAPISGRKLVDTLRRYSERGEEYVKTLRSIMVVNKLGRLDDARLSTGAQAQASNNVSAI